MHPPAQGAAAVSGGPTLGRRRGPAGREQIWQVCAAPKGVYSTSDRKPAVAELALYQIEG